MKKKFGIVGNLLKYKYPTTYFHKLYFPVNPISNVIRVFTLISSLFPSMIYNTRAERNETRKIKERTNNWILAKTRGAREDATVADGLLRSFIPCFRSLRPHVTPTLFASPRLLLPAPI